MTPRRTGLHAAWTLALCSACGRACSEEPQQRDAALSAPSSAPGPRAVAERECPEFSPSRHLGNAGFTDLTEASGLVASRRYPGVLWLHNDSGNQPVLFAMTQEGQPLARFECLGTICVDWEDLAIGPGEQSGEWYLYVSDSGNNRTARPEIILYRVNEPELGETGEGPIAAELEGFIEFHLRYEDGLAHDAETLFVDPTSGNLYWVTKAHTGESAVFEGKMPLRTSGQVLERIATLRFPGSGGSERATAGDISPDGRLIIVKTYTHAFAWRRREGESVEAALRREPCPAPLKPEPQGEALGFAADGRGYFTLSEGLSQPLYFFELEQAPLLPRGARR